MGLTTVKIRRDYLLLKVDGSISSSMHIVGLCLCNCGSLPVYLVLSLPCLCGNTVFFVAHLLLLCSPNTFFNVVPILPLYTHSQPTQGSWYIGALHGGLTLSCVIPTYICTSNTTLCNNVSCLLCTSCALLDFEGVQQWLECGQAYPYYA